MRWVVGDVHGMLRPLAGLVAAVREADPAAHFIFVGDYVNRGPDSRGVIEFLLNLQPATFLRGNHDDVFDLLINGNCYICHPTAMNPVAAFTWFMQFGLAETLMSYGIDWAELDVLLHKPSPAGLLRVLTAIPERHRKFIHSLESVYEAETFFVGHGYWNPDLSDCKPSIVQRLVEEEQLRYQLLWGRFSAQQLARKKHWVRTGYFGHTPVSNYRPDLLPVRAQNVVLVDTASALSSVGMLSAVCADDGTVIQADREGDTIVLAPE
jgi:calcineurin-like phosphoesterase family protein